MLAALVLTRARHPRTQTLASHRVLSAPVLATPTRDADEGAFEGFCDTASILRYVLSRLPPDLLSENECATVDDTVRVMDALTSLALEALQAPVSAVSRKDGDLVYAGFASITLLDIVTAAFVRPFHLQDVSICHRVRSPHAAARVSRSLTRWMLHRRCLRQTCAPTSTPARACPASRRAA